MKVVYVAGPYSGTPWEMERNLYRARAAGIVVAELGAMPLIPHSNTPVCFTGTQDEAFWYEGTMELMRRCDAVLFIEGWDRSMGSRSEQVECDRRGLPHFFTLTSLDVWLSA